MTRVESVRLAHQRDLGPSGVGKADRGPVSHVLYFDDNPIPCTQNTIESVLYRIISVMSTSRGAYTTSHLP
jgi:hypothetical protein